MKVDKYHDKGIRELLIQLLEKLDGMEDRLKAVEDKAHYQVNPVVITPSPTIPGIQPGTTPPSTTPVPWPGMPPWTVTCSAAC